MARTPSQADALFHQFLPLAESIARRFCAGTNPLIERADAVQVAQMQLWLSCHQISDPTTAAAYLKRCIKGALLHHVRDHSRLVRVPRRVHERGETTFRHASLDQCLPSGDSWLDQLATPEQAHEPVVGPELEALLDRLPASEATILRLHLLEGRSLRAIGQQLGMSAMSVQRREKAGLARLRQALA